MTKSVIFLHIPKTAGTSLHSVLSLQYHSVPSYWIDPADLDASGFKNLPPESRASLLLLRGHMQFGLHAYLPQPSVYIAFVREPISRVISYWENARAEARNFPNSEDWWLEAARTLTFEEFIELGRDVEIDNGQVRRISGMTAPFGRCSREMLKQAKDNIDRHFALVAPTNRFDEALILFKRILGWPHPLFYKMGKVRGRARERPRYSESLLGSLRELNQLDAELYDHVAKLFARQVAAADPPLRAELRFLNLLKPAASIVVPAARRLYRVTERGGVPRNQGMARRILNYVQHWRK